METKICHECEKELPATIEYFHKRGDRKGKNIILRSICITCYKASNHERRIKKILKTMSLEEYEQKKQDNYNKLSINRKKYNYKSGISFKDRAQFHRDNLSNCYLSNLIRQSRNINISTKMLELYPNVANSFRMIIMMKRANNLTLIPVINVNLSFNGDLKSLQRHRSKVIAKEHRENLTNGYVRNQIRGINGKNTILIPSEIIDLKRNQILLKRTLKNISNEQN